MYFSYKIRFKSYIKKNYNFAKFLNKILIKIVKIIKIVKFDK